ncbi:MAG TPA: hypothetical protein QKA08_00320 [Candidatus Megaira endosymbiont of Nemacystus decipiens]|nr:hypothetical protein [Candidatus Megaera endosymbiont of Nemacystus decipiens]
MRYNHIFDHFLQKSFVISASAHFILIILSLVTFPSLFHELEQKQQTITFEMVSVSDINNLAPKKQRIKPQPQKKNSKQIVKSIKRDSQTQITPKKDVIKKETSKKAIILDSKKIVDNSKPENKTNKNKIKNANKKDTTAKTKSHNTKKIVDPMESIMKNLEESNGNNKSSILQKNTTETGEDKSFFDNDDYKYNKPVSITEKNLIKHSIESNWNKPSSLPMNNGIKVFFQIKLDVDGTIQDSLHIKTICNHDSAICKIALDSVERAINKTKIIRGLAPERHDLWKVIRLHFDLELI